NDNQNPTTNPTLSRLPFDQGFCSPTNHGLHLGYTCFPLPAKETETEQACKYHGAGPRPARVVTNTLRRNSLQYCRTPKGPLLKEAHVQGRLKFANEHLILRRIGRQDVVR